MDDWPKFTYSAVNGRVNYKFRSANPRSDGILWEIRSEMDSHIDNVVEPTGVDMQAQEVCMQIV